MNANGLGHKLQAKTQSCSRKGRDVELPAVYVVKTGDTLWDLSRRYYDKGHRFEKIVRANTGKLSSPNRIYPCQRIYIPSRNMPIAEAAGAS